MTIRTFKSGDSREQSNLLPPRIEDYVGLDNPVRAIDVFVGALDFAKLGFKHADRGVGVGQPPYDPSDLLKLYLYGYVNQIRSSRRLEREAGRNLELIWLLKNLTPGYRTIATFRKENWAALKAANRSFVLLMRELGLVGGTLVAVDGALFHGNASKASIFTQGKLTKQIAALDKEIEAYGKALEANDAQEAKQRSDGPADGSKGDGDDDGIVAYVPLHEGNGKLEKEGRFSRKDFSYDASADAYRCPAGELLRPTEGRWKNASGRRRDPLSGAQSGLRSMSTESAVSCPEGILPEHRALGARGRSRTSPHEDGK